MGPNGCGKSNVIDAIKWGLGETSIKSLRADRMEDLIFSGSDSKPAVGLAEVRLRFENNGELPIDYEEVEIRRRFYRSGEGDFYINDTPCRLQDIKNLFANTGLINSILDQRIVEEFLISDSDLRRELLESVSGIKMYRQDRRESMNKLNQVENSLEKIELILKEKKKVMRSLKREANRAKRFHRFKDKLKEMVLKRGSKKLYDVESFIKEREEKISSLDKNLKSLKDKIRDEENEIELKEGKLEGKRREYERLSEEINELRDTILKLREERAGLRGEIKHLSDRLNELPENIDETIEEIRKEVNNAGEEKKKTAEEIPELESEIRVKEKELSKKKSNVHELESRELSLKVKCEEKEERIGNVEEQLEEQEKLLEEKNSELEEVSATMRELKENLTENSESVNELQKKIDEKESEKTSLLSRIQNEKSEIRSMEKEKQFYESMDSEISEGMELLKEKSKLELLSDELEADSGYEFPLEAVLGDFLNSAVGSLEDVKKAIDMLKDGEVRGGIMAVDRGESPEKKGKLSRTVSGKYAPLVRKKLNDFKFAGDIKEALENFMNEGGNWVTSGGDIIEDGFIKLHHGEEGVLTRRARKKELTAEIKEKSKKIDELEERKKDSISELEELVNALNFQKKKREEMVSELSGIELEVSRIEYDIQSIEEEKEEDAREIEDLKEAILEMKEEMEEIEKGLKDINEEVTKIDSERENLEGKLEKKMEKRRKLREEINSKNQRISELENAIHLRNEKERLKKESKSLKEIIEEKEESLSHLKKESLEFSGEIEELAESIRGERKKLSETRNKEDELDKKLEEEKAEYNRKKYEKKSLEDEIFREFGVSIQPKDEEIPEEAEEEISKLRGKIESLQPINPLAIEQYEEKKEELDGIKEQHKDLLDSKKNIKNSIEEIDRKATEQFKQTFTEIKKDFQKIYQRLSPGGNTEIRLDGDDIVNADIEVLVQPGGKSLTRMGLLSTGEKTIACISLLLAIMLKKGPPIYIMDEIDAPLDENNIERFIGLVNELAEDSQIILVTHNRRTMEESDSIYGITMEDEGVSTVLSINPEQV